MSEQTVVRGAASRALFAIDDDLVEPQVESGAIETVTDEVAGLFWSGQPEPPVELIVVGDPVVNRPAKNASTLEWQVFAESQGMTREEAAAHTRDELVDIYTDDE